MQNKSKSFRERVIEKPYTTLAACSVIAQNICFCRFIRFFPGLIIFCFVFTKEQWSFSRVCHLMQLSLRVYLLRIIDTRQPSPRDDSFVFHRKAYSRESYSFPFSLHRNSRTWPSVRFTTICVSIDDYERHSTPVFWRHEITFYCQLSLKTVYEGVLTTHPLQPKSLFSSFTCTVTRWWLITRIDF